MAMIRPKSQKIRIGYEWYSIDWKFHTDDKKIIFYFFSCPVTDQQPENVLPISVATRNFLFIYICNCSFLNVEERSNLVTNLQV
jgi:hypothetical protein